MRISLQNSKNAIVVNFKGAREKKGRHLPIVGSRGRYMKKLALSISRSAGAQGIEHKACLGQTIKLLAGNPAHTITHPSVDEHRA